MAIADVRVLGPLDTQDRRGVVSFAIDGVSAEDVCRFLDQKGVALRGGYHCAQPLLHAADLVHGRGKDIPTRPSDATRRRQAG